MHSRLVEILKEKKKEVARLKKNGIPSPPQPGIPVMRNFKSAISRPDRINLIAEIKFASPSAGHIREKSQPEGIGRSYERAGAAAISLLTDKEFFQGDLKNLPGVKQNITLPVLRKDFIIEEIQIREALAWGADAVLLIVKILSKSQLKELLQVCSVHNLPALVEVHDPEDLEIALDSRAEIIGINNRNLDTFEVDLRTTVQMVPRVPAGPVIVSESGIHTAEQVRQLRKVRVNAVLIGSSLMGSQDLELKTREMVEAGGKNEG